MLKCDLNVLFCISKLLFWFLETVLRRVFQFKKGFGSVTTVYLVQNSIQFGSHVLKSVLCFLRMVLIAELSEAQGDASYLLLYVS